jgi:hypothetical protein
MAKALKRNMRAILAILNPSSEPKARLYTQKPIMECQKLFSTNFSNISKKSLMSLKTNGLATHLSGFLSV